MGGLDWLLVDVDRVVEAPHALMSPGGGAQRKAAGRIDGKHHGSERYGRTSALASARARESGKARTCGPEAPHCGRQRARAGGSAGVPVGGSEHGAVRAPDEPEALG